jgi:hypothetical protein
VDLVAPTLASQGIATASINVVGHGGGPLGTLAVLRPSQAPVVLNAGGRGIDQDGNGAIDSTEGSAAAAPRSVISSRDGLRQTVVDIMQLVREIQVGVDIDGDQQTDLNPQRIYYAGQSFGGIYGTILLGVEPGIAAGVPNVGGGSVTEVARLGAFRPLVGIALATRVPSLINVGGASGIEFNENMPLRNLPPSSTSAGRDGDRAGARRSVGSAGRQPGGVCTVHPQAATRRPRGQAGDLAVRVRGPDGAESDDDGDPSRRRSGRSGDVLSKRPRTRSESRGAGESTHVPDQHRLGCGSGIRDRGAIADRGFLREPRDADDRSGRRRPDLRGADPSAVAGTDELLMLRRRPRAIAAGMG